MVQPGASMEYELTKSIKRLTVSDKPKVGFIRGHGEPDIRSLGPVLQELSTLYELDTLDLNVPNAWTEFKTLVLLAPSDSLPLFHLEQLDQFLASGGRLLAGVNAVEGDLPLPVVYRRGKCSRRRFKPGKVNYPKYGSRELVE